MKEKQYKSINWIAASVLVGNICVGAAVIAALIVLKNGLALIGLLVLPSLWTSFKIGGETK